MVCFGGLRQGNGAEQRSDKTERADQMSHLIGPEFLSE